MYQTSDTKSRTYHSKIDRHKQAGAMYSSAQEKNGALAATVTSTERRQEAQQTKLTTGKRRSSYTRRYISFDYVDHE